MARDDHRENDRDEDRDAEYRIVKAGSAEDPERKVNRLIERGWRVQGGVSVHANFYQAMVR